MPRRIIFVLVAFALLCMTVAFWHSVSFPIFNRPYSTVVASNEGELLSARIAADGQWRFPAEGELPDKFKSALLTFEDRHFYEHQGIDLAALGQAAYQNIKAAKVVRGGSTLTMQLVRLASRPAKRNVLRKVLECIRALRLELTMDKEEILKLYAAHAPFGGNVVGVEAASWRYYSRPVNRLSWAESAALAVLPNNPSAIYPGKNDQLYKAKRDRLLQKLKNLNYLSEPEYLLALQEPLPGQPKSLPMEAPHFLSYCEKTGLAGKRVYSALKTNLQYRVNEILRYHQQKLVANSISHAAAMVLEVESGKVTAYAGNVLTQDKVQRSDVDIIQSERSTGSILKPLLFAMTLSDGKLLYNALVPDIPTIIGGYAPRNFYPNYDGAVKLYQSVSRSLNVPSVRLLNEYGIEKFHFNLKQLGITSLHKPASHYGLSIILGGAEATLWDLAFVYRHLAYSLKHYPLSGTQKVSIPVPDPLSSLAVRALSGRSINLPVDAGSIWLMMEAMNEVARPEEEAGWKVQASSYKIAWKTGTSFGYRDGWAIGCTPAHVVAVWVGNADGQGRPELTGIGAAAPIMFDIFSALPSSDWFDCPYTCMREVEVCSKSGYKLSEFCESADAVIVQWNGINSPVCPFHKRIFIDPYTMQRVSGECESVHNMVAKNWFVLPPAMEHYFQKKNSSYKPLPELRENCHPYGNASLQILYPQAQSRIHLPLKLDGESSKIVFEAAHRAQDAIVYWSIDELYIGSTTKFHQMEVQPLPGQHVLQLIDDKGEQHHVTFEVVK